MTKTATAWSFSESEQLEIDLKHAKSTTVETDAFGRKVKASASNQDGTVSLPAHGIVLNSSDYLPDVRRHGVSTRTGCPVVSIQ